MNKIRNIIIHIRIRIAPGLGVGIEIGLGLPHAAKISYGCASRKI